MNRRDLIKRIAAAGLIATAPEIILPEKRFWQLDRTMAEPKLLTVEAFDHLADDLMEAHKRISLELEEALLYGRGRELLEFYEKYSTHRESGINTYLTS